MTHDDVNDSGHTATARPAGRLLGSMAPAGRRPLNAFVTDEAHEGWRAFAERHGVTVSALLEVLGRRLHAGDVSLLSEDEIDAARTLDADRRRRRSRGDVG